MLDDLGLLPALLWLFERYTGQIGVRVDFTQFGLEGQRFGPEIETAAYRIVQEALTNVMRHAQAQHVRVELRQSGTELHLLIRDNGKGMDSAKIKAKTNEVIQVHVQTGRQQSQQFLNNRNIIPQSVVVKVLSEKKGAPRQEGRLNNAIDNRRPVKETLVASSAHNIRWPKFLLPVAMLIGLAGSSAAQVPSVPFVQQTGPQLRRRARRRPRR